MELLNDILLRSENNVDILLQISRCLSNITVEGVYQWRTVKLVSYRSLSIYLSLYLSLKDSLQLSVVEKDWLRPLMTWIKRDLDSRLTLTALTALANLASTQVTAVIVFATIDSNFPTLLSTEMNLNDDTAALQLAQLVANLSEHGMSLLTNSSSKRQVRFSHWPFLFLLESRYSKSSGVSSRGRVKSVTIGLIFELGNTTNCSIITQSIFRQRTDCIGTGVEWFVRSLFLFPLSILHYFSL
jgi:hypothetical protein